MSKDAEKNSVVKRNANDNMVVNVMMWTDIRQHGLASNDSDRVFKCDPFQCTSALADWQASLNIQTNTTWQTTSFPVNQSDQYETLNKSKNSAKEQ